ncbi:unnamed protein product [Owenia fusiformis]|uniref:Transmembrane protein n=1 Tax=Owenia fusiformis TaxID=6347 RepID=A0A8S4N5H0_OWEFU|nr:unnamed protein product [Owenia fusiformis]
MYTSVPYKEPVQCVDGRVLCGGARPKDMSSLDHDDAIEILSVQLDNSISRDVSESPFFTDILKQQRNAQVLDKDEPPTAKQKKVARIVGVIAFLMIAMSMILVGVTLAMSDHIDDMDGSTPEPTPTRISTNQNTASNGTLGQYMRKANSEAPHSRTWTVKPKIHNDTGG